MYNFIIFDVDGTLIDTEKAVFESYQKVIHDKFGRYFSTEELAAAYGVPTNESLARLGFTDVESASRQYHRYLMERFCSVKPFDGMLEVLDTIREKKLVTGVVTSRDRNEVMDDACFQKLVKHFMYVVCADDTIKHKPNPDPLLKCIELAGADISNTLYIGDTHYDYMCAKSAGVDFALAGWGAKNSANIEPLYNLSDPTDILKII